MVPLSRSLEDGVQPDLRIRRDGDCDGERFLDGDHLRGGQGQRYGLRCLVDDAFGPQNALQVVDAVIAGLREARRRPELVDDRAMRSLAEFAATTLRERLAVPAHQTRRQGSPHTLVLTKTREVFDRELRARDQWRRDLASITREWGLDSPE